MKRKTTTMHNGIPNSQKSSLPCAEPAKHQPSRCMLCHLSADTYAIFSHDNFDFAIKTLAAFLSLRQGLMPGGDSEILISAVDELNVSARVARPQ